MKETIFLTGVAGFIGWRTAELLLEAGHRVIGIDNLNDYYDVKLKHHRLTLLKTHPLFKFYEGDIEDLNTLKAIFESDPIGAVINLAARAGVRASIKEPHLYLSTNAGGTLNLLEAMRMFNIKKMVLASTSSIYAGERPPFREDLPVNTPISPYAASKKAAEVMAYTYHYLFGLDITVLRYFTVYGPAGRPDMSVLRFIKLIDEGKPIVVYGDGTQKRDFTYIDDIAEGTLKALLPLGYRIINLGGGGPPQPLNYLIACIEEHLGKKAIVERMPFEKADMKETIADITCARQTLGWQPKILLDEGIRRTVLWYNTNRHWLKDLRL